VGKESEPRSSGRLKSWIWTAATVGLACLVIGTLVGRALLVGVETRLPDVLSVVDYRAGAAQVSRVYDRNGTVIGEFFEERRSVIPGDEIPLIMKQAAVAAEDGDFYEHRGLDYLGIARAMWVNLRAGRFSQGASTITQQVARSFYLTQEKSLERKFKEAVLAMHLERHLTKDEILELYLNQIYFGHGRYGIVEAARFYLGKTVSELDAPDAALLMAMVPAPVRLNPLVAPAEATRRRNRILDRMAAAGTLDGRALRRSRGRIVPSVASQPPRTQAPVWFVDAVRRHLEESLGERDLKTAGLKVFTTFDPEAQAAVDGAVREHIGEDADAPETAIVVLSARTREVLAMAGGTNFARSPFNRAIQAHRQAGSTFKPFVYGAGLAEGRLDPRTTYPNSAVSYRGGSGPWQPKNADGVHDGVSTTIAEALSRSLNVIAVQALRDVGVARFTDFARRVGIRSAIPPNLTAALGSAEVTPMEMANAYATVADDGGFAEPVLVRRVEDRAGRVIHAQRSDRRQAIDTRVAAQLTGLLRSAVEEGTGRRAQVRGVGVAGKTGTTNRRTDAWFVGYTTGPARLVTSVWVGHDDGRPMGGTGGSTAAPIFATVVEGLVSARAAREVPR
jgi:penicillin-binding protein 1A